MAKALVVIYLIALAIGSAAAYTDECAVGPEYWCKSFQNAQDCGAIGHCTDTVWSNDNKYASVDSSTTCQWCQRVFENTHQALGDNQNMIVSALTSGCQLLPSEDLPTKCTNVIENYETPVVSLMKKRRYATLCLLMNICSSESVVEKSPVIVGANQCTWGPSYWCKSLSNSRDCNSLDHCSNKIWSQQSIKMKDNDNICQNCESVIGQLRSIITADQAEVNDGKWLTGACSILQTKDAIDECVKTMSQYADEIVVLIKNNIDPGIICHLGQMCKEATIITSETIDDVQSKEESADDQSKMLCNVIVRATYELHLSQQKTQDDIEIFLKNDCQQLSNSKLTQQCVNFVDRHGNNIYGHVTNNMELSKICDLVERTAHESCPRVQCNICTVVLATTKSMLDAEHSEDDILLYIDEHLCSHLKDEKKKNCKYMIATDGKYLINNIQRGIQPMLLCTYFQVCFNDVVAPKSPVQRSEIRSFLKENLCDYLGPFEDSCHALMNKDTTLLLKTLVNDMEGDVLCQIFGICPTKMSFIDTASISDDKNKCKRCVDDFTRRQHIGEKLLNYSAEFLHHLCGQLSQPDECIKSVDEPIKKLIQFVQSLNPQDICVELKLCNQTLLETIEITSTDSAISEEVIVYIKSEICPHLGPSSYLCNRLIDSEGAGLFSIISEKIDPHQVCSVIDICPATTVFETCDDKCDCCVAIVENYQVQLASLLNTMHMSMEGVCRYMPGSEECRDTTAGFKSSIDEIISRFDATQICQVLTHCSAPPAKEDTVDDKCQDCQNDLNNRQDDFRNAVNEITTVLISLCTDDNYLLNIQLNQQKLLNQIANINSSTICQGLGLCSYGPFERSLSFLADLLNPFASSTNQEYICLEFGDLKPICEHLMISTENKRYVNVYMALLKNDRTLIDNDLSQQNASTCDGCKNAVQSSKDFWINSLESARNVLLQTCESCPLKDQCRDFYNQRFDSLKSYLNQTNPEQVCQTIHLCSISLIDTCSTCTERLGFKKYAILQAVDRVAGYFTDLCQQNAGKKCQTYVKHIYDSIQQWMGEFHARETCTVIGFCRTDGVENELDFDQYEKYLENDIEKKFCSTLGPFETLCKAAVRGNTEQIQTLMINYDIESLMKMGEESTESSSSTEDLSDLDDFYQDKCRSCVARVIRRKWTTKFIGDKIFHSLYRSCDRCPAKHRCRKHYRIAKERFDAHIDRVIPEKVCIHLGFCNESIEENELEVEEIQPIDDSNSTCILCEYVMNVLSNYIPSQSSKEEIEQSLQQVCNQLPSVLQNQCREYIDNYGPSIIAILIDEFDLSTVCQKLNLCGNQMKIDITHLSKADTATCGICDYISTYLYFALKRDSNDKSLQHALATVCTHLSDEQSPKCQTIIQLFTPHIRQLELSSGNNFCKQLTICQTPMIELETPIPIDEKPAPIETNIDGQSIIDETLYQDQIEQPSMVENYYDDYPYIPSETEEPTVIKSAKATPECTLCHYVISYLDAVLKNNKSEQAVEAALEKVCTILPEKERTECNQFVKSYGAVIAELIAGVADPDTICRYLGVCQDSTTKKSTTVAAQTPYTCTICHFIVSRMKESVNLNQAENEVLASLKDSCDLFSVISLKKQCRDFVDQRGSYFSEIISNDIEPKVACRSIGICGETYDEATTSDPVSPSTKSGKCIFGMNYWCTSRENAELCNAVELCERHVWSKKNIVII